MDEITLSDYRCFHAEQRVRLAPLTILVGENSTGKTSFLALIRALWEIAYQDDIPDFKAAPYDLGSFDEVVHFRGNRTRRAESFRAAFRTTPDYDGTGTPISFEVTFGKFGTAPVPIKRRVSRGVVSVEATQTGDQFEVDFATANGTWHTSDPSPFGSDDMRLTPMGIAEYYLVAKRPELAITDADLADIRPLIRLADLPIGQTYAGAPVRSKPRRTYDPARQVRDPEGDHVPMYLASLYGQAQEEWEKFRDQLQAVGRSSGLFDELSIKRLGSTEGAPFQVQIRKHNGGTKGPMRNLIDVGYGVSQALPLISELLRPDATSMFLLQQPEVHLHPSAQAALGTLFCSIASPDRQLVVETHSDYIIDRVRMEVRDTREGVGIGPGDVSILFFERRGLDVKIHSIRIDAEGNVRDAPDSYGKFFMEETRRSIGL